jgi:hypothetical protein
MEEELELEQLDYIRRNSDKTMHIPKENQDYPNILKEPLDERVLLSPEQEKRLLNELTKANNEIIPKKNKIKIISIQQFFDIFTESFVDIMDDLVNFDGDLENFTSIFVKDDRLIFVATVLLIIGLVMLFSKSSIPKELPL